MTNISWQKRAMLKGSAATAAMTIAMLVGPSAFAQTASTAAPAEADTIVVTGSLIKNPNLERSSPVTVTTADEIDLQQANLAEEILREIPGVVPSVGSAVNNGNGGASFVNLRGLGSNRNIVLIDGNRLTPAELVGRFDLNNIPVALVERVEVLTGGASTTYGADAVSGVVNFLTRQDFAGMELNVGMGLTERGDGQTLRADLTLGANFDDGRGNVVLSVGYQEADQVLQGDRKFSETGYATANGAVGGSGTGVPSRIGGVNTLGLDQITSGCGGVGQPACQVVQGTRQITNDGTGFRPTAAFDPFNFNPYNVFQTPFKRFNIYSAGRYELNENLEFYARGLFSKNKVQTVIAPSGVFGSTVTVPLSNPFLTTTQRNALCNFDTNTGPGITPRFDAATCAAAAVATNPTDPNYRSVTVTANRRNVEGGPRISTYDTTYFDYRAGLRGAITSTIDYDVSGAYGESENEATATGYWLTSRVRQAVNATSTTDCIDPSNGCVPLNIFGAGGSITPEMLGFLEQPSKTTNKFSLTQARGTIAGDFGAGVPFAANPIGFAVGVEWRDYNAQQSSDLLSQSGDLGGGGGAAPNIDGGFSVWEAFGEVVVPIVQDVPFFEDLTFNGGVRYSNYSVDAPNSPSFDTFTWKAGGSWSPGGGFKVRGNYARAVRAPNINELFSPVNTTLTSLDYDPCANLNDQGGQIPGRPIPSGELLAVCLAQGAPQSSIGAISVPTAGQAQSTGGGNLGLEPETSDSWTLGVVYQPEFAPGLSLTVDYYNIIVNDAITVPTPDDAITACFGSADANGNYTPSAGASSTTACTQIRRNGQDGSLSGDATEVQGLFLSFSNLGRLETSGVDFSANYATDFGAVRWSIALNGNWTEKSTFQAAPGSLNRDCVGLISQNCGSLQPDWQFSMRNTFSISDFDFSLLWRHISSMESEFGDNFAGTITGGALAGKEVDFNSIPSYDYFDLSLRFTASENFTFTFTIANLFDAQPTVVGSEAGTTAFNSGNVFPSTYDALGRRYAVGARLRF